MNPLNVTLAELPTTTKERVVEIVLAFDGEPFGVGVAAAGLSAFGFAKNHPELNINPEAADQVLQYKRQIAEHELAPNREAYEGLVIEVLEEAAQAEFENLLQDLLAQTCGGSIGDTDQEADPAPQAQAGSATGDTFEDRVNVEEQADNVVAPVTPATEEAPAEQLPRSSCF